MNPAEKTRLSTVSILVTDLDDTLWNWFELWYCSFKPMFDALVKKLGISEDALKTQIQAVYQKHKTSEYSFLLQELPCVRERYGPGFNPYVEFPEVIQAYRNGRKNASRLYPGVIETLNTLQCSGITIAGFTEAQFFYAAQRIRVLGLDGIIGVLYSTQNQGLPPIDALEQLRNKPGGFYRLAKTRTVELPVHQRKPDPALLLKIVEDLHAQPGEAIYVGDKLYKDVLMANRAGIRSVHAAYGETYNDSRYELLQAVTNWPEAELNSESTAKSEGVTADFTLTHSFAEILDFFVFQPQIALKR